MHTYQDSAQALAELDNPELEIDAVVTDILMPNIDGLDLCRKLSALKSLKDVPLLLISSNASLEMELDAYNAGCFDFISKPLEPKTLFARLGKALNVKQQMLAYREKIAKARSVALTAMNSNDRLSAIFQLSDRSNTITCVEQLAAAVFETLEKNQLKTSLLFKDDMTQKFFSANGLVNPLEKKMLIHAHSTLPQKSNSRLYKFKGRIFIHFDTATLFVKNADAVEDSGLQDYLAALMNFVNAKVKILFHQTRRETERKNENEAVISRFEKSAVELKDIFQSQMESVESIMDLIMSEMLVNLSSLDIGEQNEASICELVRGAFVKLHERMRVGSYTFDSSIEELLEDLHIVLFDEDKKQQG